MSFHPEVERQMARATEAMTPEQYREFIEALVMVALAKPFYTADDVWSVVSFPETRGIGSLMRKASTRDLARNNGYVRKESAQGGRWQFTQWKSLVHDPDFTEATYNALVARMMK
jgi:predicted acyltransferase